MKSFYALLGMGLCAAIVVACATDAPDEAETPDDQTGVEATDQADIQSDTAPTGWTAVDLPDLPAGAVMVSTDDDALLPCPANRLCVYQNADFKGRCSFALNPEVPFPDLRVLPCPNGGTFNNQMSSWKNLSSQRSCWFKQFDFMVTPHVMKPHTKRRQLSKDNNDTASSIGPC